MCWRSMTLSITFIIKIFADLQLIERGIENLQIGKTQILLEAIKEAENIIKMKK